MFTFLKNNNIFTSVRVIAISEKGYIVKDKRGRKFTVESKTKYKVGDALMVKNGRVIKKVARCKNIKHFNV